MKLHELKPSPGSHHPRKRVGRGPGSGHGKTSTRGQKGQGARTSVNLPKPAGPADAPQPAETPESAPTAAPSGKAEKKQKAAKPTGKSDQPAANASNSADSPKPQKGKKKG